MPGETTDTKSPLPMPAARKERATRSIWKTSFCMLCRFPDKRRPQPGDYRYLKFANIHRAFAQVTCRLTPPVNTKPHERDHASGKEAQQPRAYRTSNYFRRMVLPRKSRSLLSKHGQIHLSLHTHFLSLAKLKEVSEPPPMASQSFGAMDAHKLDGGHPLRDVIPTARHYTTKR